MRIQSYKFPHTLMETIQTYVSVTGKCCFIMSESVLLLLHSLWHHPRPTRKPWTKGRKRVPRTQRRQGYIQKELMKHCRFSGGKCFTGMTSDKQSKTFVIFAGDPGRPGLPGLPGTYTVQIPHNVQKRDAGKIFKKLSNHIKMSSVTYM